jgi:hypothetical protein
MVGQGQSSERHKIFVSFSQKRSLVLKKLFILCVHLLYMNLKPSIFLHSHINKHRRQRPQSIDAIPINAQMQYPHLLPIILSEMDHTPIPHKVLADIQILQISPLPFGQLDKPLIAYPAFVYISISRTQVQAECKEIKMLKWWI